MTLLTDVIADRSRLEQETEALIKRLVLEAKACLVNHHAINPVAAAIIGSQAYLWPLDWRSSHERGKVLAGLNSFLDENNATTTIFGFQEGSSLLMAIETPAWRKLVILPFTVQEDDTITFGDPKWTSRFSSPLHGPSLN